ncbi:MAG: Asp23/Gls24 family envelope stress response protein [Oscillospiraceae bacterium]|nr:Asp23/Gls24 family envelope stress response protein [Oscillospiraceae bacterium]
MMKNEFGSIKISNDCLANIAGNAATSCYGVVGMAVRSGKDGIAKLLKREKMSKGIKIRTSENAMAIDLYIMVEYGVNIGTIADSIKDNVKYQVELVTGLDVKKVNVHVEGVRIGD